MGTATDEVVLLGRPFASTGPGIPVLQSMAARVARAARRAVIAPVWRPSPQGDFLRAYGAGFYPAELGWWRFEPGGEVVEIAPGQFHSTGEHVLSLGPVWPVPRAQEGVYVFAGWFGVRGLGVGAGHPRVGWCCDRTRLRNCGRAEAVLPTGMRCGG